MIKLKRYLKNLINLALVSSVFVFSVSCSFQKPPSQKGQFKQRIIDAAEKNLGIKAVTFLEENTLYIYFPTEERLLDVVQADKGIHAGDRLGKSFTFFNSKYERNVFTIEYAAKELPSPTMFHRNINFNYTPYTQRLQENIINILFKSIDSFPEEVSFCVVGIADISQGIIVNQTFHVRDIHRFRVGALPGDEFVKRVLTEIVGNRKLIGDRQGRSINRGRIELAGFVNDLLSYNFFVRKKPKDEDLLVYMQRIFYMIVKDYGFDGYRSLRLIDVVSGETLIFFPYEIKETAEKYR